MKIGDILFVVQNLEIPAGIAASGPGRPPPMATADSFCPAISNIVSYQKPVTFRDTRPMVVKAGA